MPAKKSHDLIESELRATLDRFVAWQTRARANPKEGRRNATPMTARGYAARVSRFLRWAATLNPTHEQAKAYHDHFLLDAVTNRGGPNSASSGRQNAYALRSWYEFRGSPLPPDFLTTPTLPKPDTPAFLDLDECRRLLEAIDNRRDYALISTLLYSGIRASEAAALKVRHFDPDLRLLRVPARGTEGRTGAKGEKARTVVIHEKAAEAIALMLRHRDDGAEPEAPLFRSEGTKDHLTTDRLSEIVRLWSKRSIGRQVSAHILRHTFCVWAADDAGGKPPMPIKKLAEQVGHSQITTTMRYVHAAKGDLRESYDRSVPTF